MKGFFSLSLLTGLLFGAYIDTDIDGVEDSLDLCKNTPFDQLVDAFGCSENASENIWTLKAGTELGFDTFDEKSLSYHFSIDYNMQSWSMGISNANYIGYNENNTSTRETGDIYTYIGYEIPNKNFLTTFAIGMKIATADESVGTGENDYYMSTQLQSVSNEHNTKLFSTLSYTFTGDTKYIAYEDVFSYTVGLGYVVNEAYYTSLYYENSQSIYKDTESYKALVWSNHYTYDEDYFIEMAYTRGLDIFSYKHLFSFSLGVTFE